MSKDSAELLGWFGKRKENVVTVGLHAMMLSVQDCVRELGIAVRSMEEGEVSNANKAIDRLFQCEHAADAQEDELCNQISIGELGPQERQDFMAFIRKTDHIANWSKEAAIHIRLVGEVGMPVPKVVWSGLSKSVSMLESEVRNLSNAIEIMGSNTESDIMECIRGIRELERSLDQAYYDMTKLLFQSDIDAMSAIMVSKIIDSIEQAADAGKACSDTVAILHYAKRV